MNIQQLRTDQTSKASHLTAAFAKDVNAEGKHIAATEQYPSIARRYFDDITFGIDVLTTAPGKPGLWIDPSFLLITAQQGGWVSLDFRKQARHRSAVR